MQGWCIKSKDESGKRDTEVGGNQNQPIVGGYPVGDHSITQHFIRLTRKLYGGPTFFTYASNFEMMDKVKDKMTAIKLSG